MTTAAVGLALTGVGVVGTQTASAAGSGPCDIYAAGGTPCVAAHSTTRALYASYNGSLYQVRRSSDGRTANIGPVSAGGYANAGAQDSFCANTTCLITVIYDQSGRGNNLTQAPGGGAAGGPDNLANATAAPTTVNGHKVYGVFVAPGTGYRNDHTSGIATGDRAEGCTRSSTARTTTAAAASTTATPRRATTTPATATWRPSTSATSRSGATGPATDRGSWPTWRTACSPA
ncbi:hypothetical protein GCM10018954_029350 [Kutzneria kofuensis]